MFESTMLVISDDPNFIEPINGAVRPIDGLKVEVRADLKHARSYDSWDRVALVLIHLGSGGSTSEVLGLLQMISAARWPVATLVVADRADAEQGLTLLRQGVADYLGRPLDLARVAYLAEVLTVRARDAARPSGTELVQRAVAPVPGPELLPPVEGEEDESLMNQVRRVAPQDATILLSGETGTGKSRLAHRIHELSNRRSEPFLTVHCGSLTAGQVDAELFGQARGSLPGVDRDRPSKFEAVGRGTLFLDEVDALPISIQSKLLRVVEDRVFEASGSGHSVPVRARLIASSNRDLEQEVAAQRFRSDLFYRLNVIGFRLTPLRQRRASIPALVSRFVAESSASHSLVVDSIAPAALRALMEYEWPGNIRELKNTIERTIALGPGRQIQLGDLPEMVTRRDSPIIKGGAYQASPPPASSSTLAHSTLAEIKRDAELARITEALEKHSNNRLRAASELGISRMTLYKKLYKYGLMQPSPGGRVGHD